MIMVNASNNNLVIPTKVGMAVFTMQRVDLVILH